MLRWNSGRSIAAACGLAVLVALGCDAKAPIADSAAVSSGGPVAGPAGPPKPAPFREYWEEHFLRGAKFGHTHTAYYRDVLAGEPVVRIESSARMVLKRTNQTIAQSIDTVSWQTEAGEVRKFRYAMTMPGSEQTTDGLVRGGEAILTLQTTGKATIDRIPWPRETRGESGATDELTRPPMKPGEKRTISMFVPFINQIAQVTLTAGTLEATDVGGTKQELLRVVTKTALPGGVTIESIVWADAEGNTIKSFTPGLEQLTLRTTREQAQQIDPAGIQLDLGFATKVPTSPPLLNPQATKRVRYRIAVQGADAAAVFLDRESQRVRKLDDGAAEVTVIALRPDSPSRPEVKIAPPNDGDTARNSWVQSDDPLVVQLADSAAGGATDPWQIGIRMEQFLHERWNRQPISSAFASASDVAKTLTGDCTEYSVLLAAMLRAKGIPARAAIGLVYVEEEQAFLYHMWVEAFIAERWLPLDAAWGRGGASAAYLKIAETNLAGIDPFAAMLPVAQVMGKLKIDVLEQE